MSDVSSKKPSLLMIANQFEAKLGLVSTAEEGDADTAVSKEDKKKAKAMKKATKAEKKANKAVKKATTKRLAVDDPEAYKVMKADKKAKKAAKKAGKANVKAKEAAAKFESLCK